MKILHNNGQCLGWLRLNVSVASIKMMDVNKYEWHVLAGGGGGGGGGGDTLLILHKRL